jgi:hypothetical protein
MHVHAFSPMEIVNGAARAGTPIREWLSQLKEAGLDTIPGTAAEILDDEVRWVLTKGKLPTKTWVEVVTTAHEVGLRSSSTMMYGHVDAPRHWVSHLRVLQRIQDQTGGFVEFVPLPFVHQSAPLYLAGAAPSSSPASFSPSPLITRLFCSAHTFTCSFPRPGMSTLRCSASSLSFAFHPRRSVAAPARPAGVARSSMRLSSRPRLCGALNGSRNTSANRSGNREHVQDSDLMRSIGANSG